MKILLADDDKVERLALRQLIGDQPHLEIVEVEDGQAALDALCDGLRPALCILDIRMPKIDGIELLQRLRRDPVLRGLKVVMTSATRDRETILTLAKLQIAGYLLKPYDAAKTRAVLAPLLTATAADPKLASRNLLAKTVLVVDGDDDARAALEAVARNESGWDVVSSKSGQEALTRLYRGLRPDLIITDLIMPEMDGIAFVTRLREDPLLRSLKIAVMSASAGRENVATLAALGVRHFIGKPIDVAKITALLRTGAAAPAEEEASSPR